MQLCARPVFEKAVDKCRPAAPRRRAIPVQHGDGFCFGLEPDFWHRYTTKKKAGPEGPAKTDPHGKEIGQEDRESEFMRTGQRRKWPCTQKTRWPRARLVRCDECSIRCPLTSPALEILDGDWPSARSATPADPIHGKFFEPPFEIERRFKIRRNDCGSLREARRGLASTFAMLAATDSEKDRTHEHHSTTWREIHRPTHAAQRAKVQKVMRSPARASELLDSAIRRPVSRR